MGNVRVEPSLWAVGNGASPPGKKLDRFVPIMYTVS